MKALIEKEKAIIKFGDIGIEKQNFHQHKRPISIKNVHINKIVVSTKTFFDKKGFKYFIGYKDAKYKPLCIFLSKMIAYGRHFNETKRISFWIKDDELLEKSNEILEKVKNSIKKKFVNKPVYNEKYLKTKIKSYDGKFNKNFHKYKKPREGFQFICLSVILVDSVFRTGKHYYPQVLLEECKYVVKEKRSLSILLKISKFPLILIGKILMIKVQMKKNSDEENSDEENSGKENFDEESFHQ